MKRMIELGVLLGCVSLAWAGVEPVTIGSRLEPFVDRCLIDALAGDARLVLHEPVDRGPVMSFGQPWAPTGSFITVIHDPREGLYRLYYRGTNKPGDGGEVTCYAESSDGVHWTKPSLGLHEVRGSTDNNVIWAPDDRTESDPTGRKISHNFAPFLDQNPDAPADARYKALGGTGGAHGLYALASADGVHWRVMSQTPVITHDAYAFDSQNVAFWSPQESKYLAYVRLWIKSEAADAPPEHPPHGIRTIGRAESHDFIHWTPLRYMSYTDTQSDVPGSHLYINQTHPYFRAPHVYLGFGVRVMPARLRLFDAEAGSDRANTSDTVLLTTRGGYAYDRTFLGALIRPPLGRVTSVHPARGVVPFGPTEMSMYARLGNQLHRYAIRPDGFASVRAGFEGGELLTRPLTFAGGRLSLNFATSAAGSVRVEIQDADGRAIPGYSLDESVELIGNEIERAVRWTSGEDVSPLAGKPVRLRFVIKDADLYALQFVE